MELSQVGNTISGAVADTAINAGVGYLAVWAFTSINPVIGAVFGAAYGASGTVVDPIFNTKDSTLPSKVLGTALKMGISAEAVMLGLGAAVTLKTTLTVSLAILVITPAVATAVILVAGGVGACAALALRH